MYWKKFTFLGLVLVISASTAIARDILWKNIYGETRDYGIMAVTTSNDDSSNIGENTVNGAGRSPENEALVNIYGFWQTVQNPPAGILNSPVNIDCKSWIMYTLDTSYKLGKLVIWNMNQPGGTARGFNRIRIHYTNVAFPSGPGDWQEWTQSNGSGIYLTPAPGRGWPDANPQEYWPRDVIDLGDINARSILISQITDFGGDGYYGLSNVRILEYEDTVAPEKLEIKWHGLAGPNEPNNIGIIAVSASDTGDVNNWSPENTVNSWGREFRDPDTSVNYKGYPYGWKKNIYAYWQTHQNPPVATSPAGFTCKSWIMYDFDMTYNLYKMYVWNMNLPGTAWSRGFKDARIHVSTIANPTSPADWTEFVLGAPNQLVWERAPGLGWPVSPFEATPRTKVLFNGVAAKHVLLSQISDFSGMVVNGTPIVNDGYYGLSDVRFYRMPATCAEKLWAPALFGVSPADFNTDCIINFKDLAIFAGSWLKG